MTPKPTPKPEATEPKANVTAKTAETPNVTEVTPKVAKTPKRVTEAELLARYPHVVAGSLRFDEARNKQVVRAKLTCGHEHELATSDLFQVKACPLCVKAVRKDQRKARKAARKAFLATLTK